MQKAGNGQQGPREETRYRMTANPRGLCLIFNNKIFRTADGFPIPDLPTREGTDVDRDKLKTTFSALRFEVRCHENKTDMQMIRILDDVARDDDKNRQMDCFVCCILSHGSKGRVFSSNGGLIKIQHLTDRMSGLSSPELAGKPKLFFIQACQGPVAQRGCPVQIDATPDDHVFIPEHTDFLIAHSTLPEFASFRIPQNGSFFVDKLTEVLNNHAHSQDIVKMLTMVNDKIASVDLFHAHVTGISKQASVFSSSLRKDLYFNIGSPSDAADDNFTTSALAQRALLDRLVSFHEYEEPIAATRTTPLPLSAKAQAALSRTFRQLSISSDPPSSPSGSQHPPEAAPSGSPDADTSAILGRIMQVIASNQQPSTASGADHGMGNHKTAY